VNPPLAVTSEWATIVPLRTYTDVAVRGLVDAIATDVGRLRRRYQAIAGAEAWTSSWTIDRIASHVETLDIVLRPSAAELALAAFPGDDDAIAAAIEHVDREAARIRRLLHNPAAA